MKLRFSVLLTFVLLFSTGIKDLYAQLDTIHWIPPLHSRDNNQITDHYIYLSTPETSSFKVTVEDGSGKEISGSPFTISNSNPKKVNIGNGQNPGTELMVPFDSLNTTLKSSGLVMKASEPFYANSRYRSPAQGASLTAKGLSAKGKTFRLGSMPQNGDNYLRNFVASFFATEDNTTIFVLDYDNGVEFDGPTSKTANFLSISLNKGETYVISGYTDKTANQQGFVGALVNSNKPIVVNTGNYTGSISNNATLQDIGIDQIVPISGIGQDYATIEGDGQTDQERPMVVAHKNNTKVYVNGGSTPVATLNAGGWHLVKNSNYKAPITKTCTSAHPNRLTSTSF